MSKESELHTKPKIRFNQLVEDDRSKDNSEGSRVLKKNGPQVRSVVILDKPITLMRSEFKGTIDAKARDDLANVKQVSKRNQKPVAPEVIDISDSPGTSDSKHVREQKIIETEITQDDQASHSLNIVQSNNLPIQVQVPNLELPSSEDEIIVNKYNKVKRQNGKIPLGAAEEKENNTLSTNACVKSTTAKKKNIKTNIIPYTINKYKTNSSTNNARPTDLDKKKSLCSTSTNNTDGPKNVLHVTAQNKRSLCTKPRVTSVMPCHKYTLKSVRPKASPVKMTIMRNIRGKKIKPYIGPGLPRKKPDISKESKENPNIRLSGDFKNQLAKPEDNSIMTTVKRLEELKQQKLVPGVKHLPAVYKNVINEKISTALEFPLDEAIYTNLVDLSIDEMQLPNRLVRSKDPEPRQKDHIPMLSHFFNPEMNDEYCSPVFTKPCSLRMLDAWNAFKISDKILEWKYGIDRMS